MQTASSLRERAEFLAGSDYVHHLGRYGYQLKFDRENDAIVKTLRSGGPDSIALFLQVGMGLHESGGISAVNAWIKVALPALPETEQHTLVGMLIETLAENFDLKFHTETIQ